MFEDWGAYLLWKFEMSSLKKSKDEINKRKRLFDALIFEIKEKKIISYPLFTLYVLLTLLVILENSKQSTADFIFHFVNV